jgi:glyoxylate reductase
MSERRPRVGVTRRLPSAVEVLLRQRYDVVQHESPGPLDAMALVAMMREVDALLPTVTDILDEAVIGAGLGRCRMIANFGVGGEPHRRPGGDAGRDDRHQHAGCPH